MADELVSKLQQGLRGRVVGRDDADYDAARALYNGMIDKRPRLIAQCADVADVITAVNFGRTEALLVAIRGGAHNGPGLGSCDGGLVIDLSRLRGIRVDTATRTVRVEAGCTSGDVDHATHAFGLAVPFGIVSSTGVAGLTLGGGTGYLTRKHGLTIDNLLEADVVLADGSFVTTSKTQHPDLFWALLGGGGNFGVVTSFLFRAYPVSTVYAGPIFWDAKDGKQVMRAYRDYLPTAPEELGIFVGLKTVPSTDPFPKEHWGKRACAIIGAYSGPVAEGEKLMAGLLQGLPAPLFNWMGRDAIPGDPSVVRRLLPEGPAVVLERRLRPDVARRGDRRAHRAGGQGADRTVPDASVSDRRRRAPRPKRRDRVGYARCDVVHGDRRNLSGSEASRCAEGMGTCLLEGCASVQSRRCVRQLFDGRRSRRAHPGGLRGELPASRCRQGEVRPEELLPRQSEHRAGGGRDGAVGILCVTLRMCMFNEPLS